MKPVKRKIRIPKFYWKRVKKIARENHVSKNAVIADALRLYLSKDWAEQLRPRKKPVHE